MNAESIGFKPMEAFATKEIQPETGTAGALYFSNKCRRMLGRVQCATSCQRVCKNSKRHRSWGSASPEPTMEQRCYELPRKVLQLYVAEL